MLAFERWGPAGNVRPVQRAVLHIYDGALDDVGGDSLAQLRRVNHLGRQTLARNCSQRDRISASGFELRMAPNFVRADGDAEFSLAACPRTVTDGRRREPVQGVVLHTTREQ